ncbi:MAG: hypothetical protein AAGJ29_11995 [Pseudomonadota bacterium]
MIEFLIQAAQHPLTPWVVLFGIGIVLLVEIWRSSPSALLGDMFAEGHDD